ncbi:hypothetical protein K457DRAFT_886278 [Linnemannia elongata AG-77]|uniref:Uncharacterized protein n=1 Tax=Linnemannia elongata AG-77 TaxID=1314771 RepID=A0A197K8L4_9FUNG|nr:hypothetical protein K457DRAFT_886278 [Linnemannia elongata AG-77]
MMSSTSSLLTLPAVDEPLELTNIAPVLDPKIPFFKYLDMLTIISQNALSLRQQAYEIFLALNPHFSYAPSSTACNLNMRQRPVKVNKKIENLLKSSMILLQRYYLIIQVSLPKLPSFRRRTHGNSLKPYEVRAAGYQDDLKQYQEEGGLLYLQACFVRAKTAKRDLHNPIKPSVQVAGGAGVLPYPSSDGQTVAKALTPFAKSVPAAKSSDKKFPEPCTSSASTATPPVVVMVENSPKTKDHSSVMVAAAKRSPKTKDPLCVPFPVVVVNEQAPNTKEQLSVHSVIVKSTSSSSRPPSRCSSRCKKHAPEAQVEVKVKVEMTSTTTDTAATTSPPATAGEPTLPSPSVPAALTSTALWKLEKDLERLQKAEATMKEQITQTAHIRARASKSTLTAIPTTAAPSTSTTTPVVLTVAALAQLPTATPPTATSTPLHSSLPAAPSAVTSTPVHSTPATVNVRPSTVVIPANTTKVEQPKRTAKTGAIVVPSMTLTAPTPTGTPSTSHNPLTTRGTTSYNPPKETAKSTNKRLSPATGAIKGSGVVRKLIRQYETPSSASSISTQSERPDLQLNRKKKPTTTSAVTTSLTTPAGAPAKAANGLKTGKLTTSTLLVATSSKTGAGSTTTEGAGVGTGLLSRTRMDALPDLGDKQSREPVPASGVKTRPGQNTPTRNRGSIRADNNSNNGLTQPIIPPVVNTSASSASYALSKARSAIAKSALILENHQKTTLTQEQLRDQASSKPRTAAEAVKNSYLLGSQTKAAAGVDKQSPLQVPAQRQHSQTTTPTLNGDDFWNNRPPPLSQTRKVASSSVNTAISTTSVATVFRAGAENKPVVPLRDPTFTPSKPPLEARPAAAIISEVNLSNRSSPISKSSNAKSSQESINSWRRDVPVPASASFSPHTYNQGEHISTSAGSITNQPAADWHNEADYEDNDEEEDGLSHVDLIRIPTTSSGHSSATATTSFSASHPLGSDRFKPRHRPSLSSVLVQEKEQQETPKEDGKEVKKNSSGYTPDPDESDTDSANLQILEVPPTRDAQAWMRARERELEHEREEEDEEEGSQLEEDGGDDGSEDGYGGYSQLEQGRRHDGKYSIRRVDTSSQRQTAISSQPKPTHVRFDGHRNSQSSPRVQGQLHEGKQELNETPVKSGAPCFTQPFKPEHHPPIQHSSFSNIHHHVSQHEPRHTRHYAPTISSTSTRSIRQPSLAHSISPASSAFASFKCTPAPSTMAPSIKSFATGSTTTLEPPKSYPPSFTSIAVTNAAAPPSHYPTQGQADDGTTDTLSVAVRNIRAREARVINSLVELFPGTRLRQMNTQSADSLIGYGLYYGQEQQQNQQQNQQQQQYH